jgi:hypothetical protein
MPPYLRRRLFRGWDWFTPREIQHLSWRERERLTQEAWEIVKRHPRFWLMGKFLPILNGILLCCAFLIILLKISLFLYLTLNLVFLVQTVTGLVWQQRHFRRALRQKLLDAGHRPAFCFECGYDLEGYEGNDCPACDAPLLRQPDSAGSTS